MVVSRGSALGTGLAIVILIATAGATRALPSVHGMTPLPGRWVLTGNMSTDRDYPGAVLIPDGTVLVAGGSGHAPWSADLYDPATATFRPTQAMHNARA